MEEADELGESAPSNRRLGNVTRIMDSTNTEWTNEKHNMYLNSIEESFVNHLYSNDYQLNDSLRWHLRTRKDPHSSEPNANKLYFSQVRHNPGGYQENFKLETTCKNTETKEESQIVSSNTWIQHVQSSCNSKISGTSESPTPAAHSGCQRYKTKKRDGASSSNQLPVCFMGVYNQGRTEVSDQNFVEKGHDQGRLKRYFKKHKG